MVLSAYVFTTLATIVAVFQLVLALGAPLGEYTMGGKFPGKLPVPMRLAAGVQILVLFVFVFIVMAKAGLAFAPYYHISTMGIWVIVVFFAFGTIVNVSSPSRQEKLTMGPANIVALISTLVVALG